MIFHDLMFDSTKILSCTYLKPEKEELHSDVFGVNVSMSKFRINPFHFGQKSK